MKLYHGTDADIKKFCLMTCDDNRVDTSNTTYGTGIYFSDDLIVAKGFSKTGKVYEVETNFDEVVDIVCGGQRFGSISMDTQVNTGYGYDTLRELIGGNLENIDYYNKYGISLNEVVNIIRTDLWEEYDAVIMHNVIDNGWWSDDRSRESTVVAVLNDEVICIKK